MNDFEAKKTVDLWTMGLGAMGGAQYAKRSSPERERRALKCDWKTLPMPIRRAEIELGLPVTAEELDVLALGHVPRAMEDHWFVYFDGESVCFHRSWTGICIYKVHVRHNEHGGGYVLSRVTANRERSHYSETSDERDYLLVTILVGQALGRDVEALWEAYHSVEADNGGAKDAGETVLGFWKETDPLGFLSNWHDSGFEFLGRRFATSEHWIMWQKARVMGDEATASEVLAADGPKRAKELGGKVHPYVDRVWRTVREELAYVGIREKFLQNPDLARELMATGGYVLAEASPYDHVWGVGIAKDGSGFADLTGWKGDNLQGRICMRARADLRLLMPDGLTRHDVRTTKEDLEDVLASRVGGKSLIVLARDPITRPAALCYATIAEHLCQMQYGNVNNFLKARGRTSLVNIDNQIKLGVKRYFTAFGFSELLAQLAFLRRIGVL